MEKSFKDNYIDILNNTKKQAKKKIESYGSTVDYYYNDDYQDVYGDDKQEILKSIVVNIEKLEITEEKKQELKERFTIFEGEDKRNKGFYKRIIDIEDKHNRNITFLDFLDNEIAEAQELLPQKEKSEKSKLDEGEKFVILVNGYTAIVFDKSNHEISIQDGKLLNWQ
jgi:hypothetical protein